MQTMPKSGIEVASDPAHGPASAKPGTSRPPARGGREWAVCSSVPDGHSRSAGPSHLGTPTVELTTAEIDASSWITLWLASAEKPRPPYSLGTIMPKNLLVLMNSHISGGRAARTWVMSQSLVIAQTCSHGPSRNACSSADSLGAGWSSNTLQSGLPENNSPSKPTVPASNATRSVSDSGGSILV